MAGLAIEGEIQEVFLVHRGKGAENERPGELIGTFSSWELARDVAKGQGSLTGSDGKVVSRHAVVVPPTTPNGTQDAYVLDPAYEDIDGAFRNVLDDDAGLREIRDRALAKLTPEERAVLGFPDESETA
jgi:hypothetical protein